MVAFQSLEKNSTCTVTFCTDSFDDDDIDYLREQIKRSIGVDTGTRLVHRKFRRIVIHTKSRVKELLKYIGNPPVPEMNYKWRISDET